MIKVKVVKDNEYKDYKNFVGNVYNALVDTDGTYCVETKKGLTYIPAVCCEEINQQKYDKIFLVEDGSIDLDKEQEKLNQMGYCVIVYRQGANKPTIIN